MTTKPGDVLELFTKAAKLPVEQRGAFLDQVCAGDPDLRHKIEALLRSNDRVGAFLEEPPDAVIEAGRAKANVGEKPGDWVDRYKPLQQIGEGGYGVVFMAEQ